MEQNPSEQDVHRVRAVEQLEALTSPARIEIVVCLEYVGSATVRELAERLGRKASSLYYHIEQLVGVGLLIEEDHRREDGRSEAKYRLVANKLTLDSEAQDPRVIDLTIQATSAVLRLTAREAATAYKKGWNRKKGMFATRLKVPLTKAQHDSIKSHLQAIDEIIRQRSTNPSEQGRVYSWTTLLVPIEEAPSEPAGDQPAD